jgi:hypothetical protein
VTLNHEARYQLSKALRSLPWYVAFGIVFGPLVAAIFTAGWGLVLYFGYFTKDGIQLLLITAGAGAFIWLLRQFVRAAMYSWRQNHRQIVRY